MKFRKMAAAAAALTLSTTTAFAQAVNGELSRVAAPAADANQFGGDSTMLLILAVLLIGAGIVLLAGNNSDKPSSP